MLMFLVGIKSYTVYSEYYIGTVRYDYSIEIYS